MLVDSTPDEYVSVCFSKYQISHAMELTLNIELIMEEIPSCRSGFDLSNIALHAIFV